MSKFRQGSHKLKTNQKIYFGTNNYAYAYFDGTDFIITTTSGNINLSPGGSGNVVLDRQIFPNTEGTIGYGLSTDGAGTLSWVEGGGAPPAVGNVGVFLGGSSGGDINVIDFITISSATNATNFGDLLSVQDSAAACSNGYTGRGIVGFSNLNTIEYITITSTGNATNFGDMTTATRDRLGAVSNGTNDRGVFAGDDGVNIIDYVTISSTSNATNFGDMITEYRITSGCSNGTGGRGVFAGGYNGGAVNTIEYITISSTGNSTNFGDLLADRFNMSATSNGTNNRGVIGGGQEGGGVNTIEYITITSASNSTNFGDLTEVMNSRPGACSNATNNRGVWAGGKNGVGTPINIICYITISSAGNAANFGDLTVARTGVAGTSNA